MSAWQRFKILPILIFVAALSFSVRMGEFVTGFTSAPGSAFAGAAPPSAPLNAPSEQAAADKPAAEGEKKAETPAATPDEGAEKEEAAAADAPSAAPGTPPSVPAPQEKVDWRDSTDTDLEQSEVTMEMFEDLANRRKDVEEREREIVLREALLKAAGQEIEQKYKELENLKIEIEELLKKQTEEEEQRVASLVKIYEGMKAKDAARIFDNLDMDVLIQVMTKMSERKSAPIIAAMNPEKARSVTIMLAEQKKIPSLAEPLIPQN